MINLDIIIPVYNEAENIEKVLSSLRRDVKISFRVLICYDNDDDTTLQVVENFKKDCPFDILFVKNQGKGVHSAILTGFQFSSSDAVLVYPGDDQHNAKIIDKMYHKIKIGSDVVAASRFIHGGSMVNCPWIKSILVRTASFTLYWFALIPIRDASNGFRMFSKRILDNFEIESTKGFTYSIELLVKCHRYGWKISEVPSHWLEREKGSSRFNLSQWLPHYVRWYLYGFKTTFMRMGPETVKLKLNSILQQRED